jgi:uncharacterized phiE125 gp8 family phage protein
MASVQTTKLTLITEPAIEPISLEEIKLHIRVTGNDEDTLLRRLVRAAYKKAERYAGRSFITQTWELAIDGEPGSVVDLPKPDLQSVTSVKAYDLDNTETTFSASNYSVDTGRASRIFLNNGASWPSSLRDYRSVVVEYVSGYGDDETDIPADVRHAVHIIAGYLYEHRDEEGKIPMLAKEFLSSEVVEWL